MVCDEAAPAWKAGGSLFALMEQSEVTNVPPKPIEGLVSDGGLTEWDNDPAPVLRALKKFLRLPWITN